MKPPFKINPLTQCWEWEGAKDKEGYGRWSNGKIGALYHRQWRTHRLAYLFRHGEIPEGKSVLHKCNNPSCVNWEHLYAGTHEENMNDRMEAGHYLHGEENPCVKYSDEIVRKIMESPKSTDSSLARNLRTTRHFVRRVRLGLTRTHITGGPLIKNRKQGWPKGVLRTGADGKQLAEPVLP